MTDSKDLALKIAVYGEDFDKNVIPLCNDADLSIAERQKQIGIFIAVGLCSQSGFGTRQS